MYDILAYAIGVMYTPGPINLLGLHSGINRQTRSHVGFFMGVGLAMFILFVLLSFVGLKVINPQVLPFVTLAGCGYILYVAYKVLGSQVELNNSEHRPSQLSFQDVLLMQLLNPKALLATLPITTIQFPHAGIHGSAMVIWSALLALLAFGAPTSYSLAGLSLGKRIHNPNYFKLFNRLMAGLLVYVALSIAYSQVFKGYF